MATLEWPRNPNTAVQFSTQSAAFLERQFVDEEKYLFQLAADHGTDDEECDSDDEEDFDVTLIEYCENAQSPGSRRSRKLENLDHVNTYLVV